MQPAAVGVLINQMRFIEGRYKFTDDDAKVIGIDSDDTPTDDACSISSTDTARPPNSRFAPRLAERHRPGYTTSSPSDSDGRRLC